MHGSTFLVASVLGILIAARGVIPFENAMASVVPAASIGHESGQEARPFVDLSIKELIKAVPELKGLEPAETQEELAPLLQKVGDGVKILFSNFPDTASIEDTRQERLTLTSILVESVTDHFRYLALPHPLKDGITLEEYRTDNKGRRVEPGAKGQGLLLITQGFVSQPLFFHPLYQSESTFRYLGRQVVDGRQVFATAFAQRPDRSRLPGRIKIGGTTHRVLFQGVAWIIASDYQIVRMRTDLLPPVPNGLSRETTIIRFAEVRFKGVPNALRLPSEVAVTLAWRDWLFRNQHRFSHFKLFRVETEEKR